MGRNWSKDKSRKQVATASRLALDDVLAFADPPEVGPNKAELRAETERLIAAFTGPVRKLPTFAALRCRSCGHRGTARVPQGTKPQFKCSQCGSGLVAWHL